MSRTRIKICGVCRAEDALAAVEAGADAIGVVLHGPSKRILTAKQANRIVGAVPGLVTVAGLFVNANGRKVAETLRQVPIDVIQLQGHETPEFVASLKPRAVVKALHVDGHIARTLKFWKKEIRRLKLTNLKGICSRRRAGCPGGSGIANDWKAILRLKKSGRCGVAGGDCRGGIAAKSVGKVVRMLRPYAVDVSSGVEEEKRKKSPEKIQKFIRAVRIADATES